MIQIEDSNWDNVKNQTKYLASIYDALGKYLHGGKIEIQISPKVDLRVASQALKELAELMDCSATIGGADAEDEDEDGPDKSNPFAPPSDDDYDSADYWKK